MMIRRKKTTIFTDTKDTATVLELKKMIEGILKCTPKDQRLYNKDNMLMDDDSKTLADYGITMMTAKAQAPAVLGLALRIDNEFETLEMCSYSQPPDLPEVMKNQDSANGEQA